MWRAIACALIALALGAAPVVAQRAPMVPPADGGVALYALPIFTSDGVDIGAVAAVGTDDEGHTVLLAELRMPLGIGAHIVAIPLEIISVRPDRIELFLSLREVRDRLSTAEPNQHPLK